MHQEPPVQDRSGQASTGLWHTAPIWRWFLAGAVVTTMAGIGVGIWSNDSPVVPAATKVAAASVNAPSTGLATPNIETKPVAPAIAESNALSEKPAFQPTTISTPVVLAAPLAPTPKKDPPRLTAREKKPLPAPAEPVPVPVSTPETKVIRPVISIEEANKNCPNGPMSVSPNRRPQSVGKVVEIFSAQASRVNIENSMLLMRGDQDPKYLNDLIAYVVSPNGKFKQAMHIHGVNVTVGDQVVFDWPYADPNVACRYVPFLTKGILQPTPAARETPPMPAQ